MQIIMNLNWASRASSFTDLMRMTINEAKAQDWTSIQSSQISIKLLSKAFASHMLQGNFAMEKVTSLEHETKKVEPSAFLPQRNKCLVERELTTKNRATNKNVMDIINSQKSTRKTAISRIGNMIDITDFSSLCINMDTVISTICTSDEPQPILRQILMNFVSLVNNPDWAKWAKSVGSMPLIHWYCYSFLEIMPSSVTAYTLSAWNNTQSCPPKEGGPATTKANANATTPPPVQHRGDKHDPTTPETSDDNNSSRHQKAKKGSKVDGPAKDRKEMGMFSLRIQASMHLMFSPRIFPLSCVPILPAKGKNVPTPIVGLNILLKPVTKDIGWFNEYHFMKVPNEEVKKLLGNVKGISVRWLDLSDTSCAASFSISLEFYISYASDYISLQG
jgi:hypothetical protein